MSRHHGIDYELRAALGEETKRRETELAGKKERLLKALRYDPELTVSVLAKRFSVAEKTVYRWLEEAGTKAAPGFDGITDLTGGKRKAAGGER